MVPIESPFAACYCGCYASRLQLLNAIAFDGAPHGLNILTSPAAFWQCLADEQPDWVVVTSQQLVQEPEFIVSLRQGYQSVGIALCVLPDSPVPALLWPMLRQLAPDTLCTLAELPACLAALLIKRHYDSCLVRIFLQLANVTNQYIDHQEFITPKKLLALTASEVRIMREIINGLCRRRIAAALFISPRTVDNHKASIARKLGAAAKPYGLTKYVLLNKQQLMNWLRTAFGK